MSHQPMIKGVGNGFHPAVDPELVENALNVVAYGRCTDRERLGYIVGAMALGQKRQNLTLALCQ